MLLLLLVFLVCDCNLEYLLGPSSHTPTYRCHLLLRGGSIEKDGMKNAVASDRSVLRSMSVESVEPVSV